MKGNGKQGKEGKVNIKAQRLGPPPKKVQESLKRGKVGKKHKKIEKKV